MNGHRLRYARATSYVAARHQQITSKRNPGLDHGPTGNPDTAEGVLRK